MNRKFFVLALIGGTVSAALGPLWAQKGTSSAIAKPKSWVQLVALTNETTYRVGEPVGVTLRATNISKNVAFLSFSSGQRFDFKVFDTQNQNVYTWSASRMFVQTLGNLVMYPGNRKTFEAQIGDEMGQLPAGKYRLEAQLSNSSQITAAPIYFSVADAPTS